MHPLQQMTLGDWSCRYHGSQVNDALGISYVQTSYRFQQLEKRFQRQSDVRKNYADVMKKYEVHGHMQLVL